MDIGHGLQHAAAKIIQRLLVALSHGDVADEPANADESVADVAGRGRRDGRGDGLPLAGREAQAPVVDPGGAVERVDQPAEVRAVPEVDERRQRLADQVPRFDPEQLGRGPIGLADHAPGIGDEIGVRRELEELLVATLVLLDLGPRA